MSKDSERGKYASPEGSSTWEYIATMSCALLIFCVGCVPGWNSPTLGILHGPETPLVLTSSQISTLIAVVGVGHTVAPIIITVMADKLGRKNSMLVAGIPAIISWGLISITNDFTVLLVARCIGGVSLGLMLVLPQMYLGEIASAKMRGAISMVCGTMISTGLLFMYVMVPYLSIHATARISMTIVIIAVVSIWFIPESPYYLAMIGRMDDAAGALEKLRGKTDVTEELDLIKATISQKGKDAKSPSQEGDRGTPGTFNTCKQLILVPGNRKALIINFVFLLVHYCGGCVVIMNYAQIILTKMEINISVNFCTMINATIQLVCNIVTTFIIDRLGRRPLICFSGIVSGSGLLVVGVYFYLKEYMNMDVTPYANFALCGFFANTIALNIGLMPLQHVIQSEIMAAEVKELETCIIGVTGGIVASIGIKSYLMLAETWHFGHCVPFFGYVFITWTSTALILKLLPETKGKTLYDIQMDLNTPS